MKKVIIKTVCMVSMLVLVNAVKAQTTNDKTKSPTVVAWDGMAVAGYVNHGGFVNFGGPTVKLVKKPLTLGFGILPTMRIKNDDVPKGSPKNSVIMPTAGFGFTVIHKQMVLQVPFYYNAKTTTGSGKWHPGIGIGFKF
ncbi:MAG TPA: hypothetical protein VJ765_08970 [Chitinophagaceae bacterium]|nr:hypothetical protein [Chitinophagaceae bacterium]